MSETYTPPSANGSAGAPLSLDAVAPSVPTWPAPSVRTRKVAILGFGDTVKDCPWKDESWELWGMNGFWRAAEKDFGITAPEARYALWFDMHSLEYTREYGARAGFGDAQERWLEKEHSFPVLMPVTNQAFPSVQAYPIDDVIASAGRDYFTSTVAYALALAVAMPDVAEIGLWGVDLVHDTEYGDQRPCAEYHIRAAEDRGIKVTIHERSALLRQRARYGYEPENELLVGMRALLQQQATHLETVIRGHQEKIEALRSQAHTDDGALQTVRGMLQRLSIYERGGRV